MRRLTFKRDRKGSVAVEFALLALPFFTILFGLLELAVVYFTETALQDALSQQVRGIRTGQVQNSNPPVSQAAFTQAVCNNMRRVMTGADCSRLYIDIRTFSDFGSSAPLPNPLDANGQFDPSRLTFAVGGAEQTVVARAFYRYNVASPLTQGLLADYGSTRLITATELFRTEPFS